MTMDLLLQMLLASDHSVDDVMDSLRGWAPSLRRQLYSELGRHGDAPKVLELLEQAVEQESDQYARWWAFQSRYVDQVVPADWSRLLAALLDAAEDEDVRLSAYLGLGHLLLMPERLTTDCLNTVLKSLAESSHEKVVGDYYFKDDRLARAQAELETRS